MSRRERLRYLAYGVLSILAAFAGIFVLAATTRMNIGPAELVVFGTPMAIATFTLLVHSRRGRRRGAA